MRYLRWALLPLFLLALPLIWAARLLLWLSSVLEFSWNIGVLLARKYWARWRR